MFAPENAPDGKKISKSAFEDAMLRLFAAHKIHVESYGPPSRGFTRLALGDSPLLRPCFAPVSPPVCVAPLIPPRAVQGSTPLAGALPCVLETMSSLHRFVAGAPPANIGPDREFVAMRRLGGRVQRQVRRAFIVTTELTTAALAKWVYPGGRKPTTSLWRVREEARRYADVVGRVKPGGLVFRRRGLPDAYPDTGRSAKAWEI
jgi:hypothetical protein